MPDKKHMQIKENWATLGLELTIIRNLLIYVMTSRDCNGLLPKELYVSQLDSAVSKIDTVRWAAESRMFDKTPFQDEHVFFLGDDSRELTGRIMDEIRQAAKELAAKQ